MSVKIQMMGMFLIEADGAIYDNLAVRSRKGVNLIRQLILQQGRPISSQRLVRALWTGRRSDNPEGALKTLVSRTRAMLNAVSQGLGGCIASDTGGYRWETLPGVDVDVLSIIQILRQLRKDPTQDARRVLTEELLRLYRGDLEDAEWLHKAYLDAVYDYAALLKTQEEYNRIIEVCDTAIAIDDMDEQLHILRMDAMVNLNRPQEALAEYRRVARQSQQYYDAELSEEMQACYRELVADSQSIRFNLDVIHNELTRDESDIQGPYFCDNRAFKEIYNIQMRNLERLGSTMFLAAVMLGSASAVSREAAMAALQEILRSNLRKGDIVTRFSDNMFAMLLPSVNYSTGGVVMERIEHLFYAEYQGGSVTFHARISPLSRQIDLM